MNTKINSDVNNDTFSNKHEKVVKIIEDREVKEIINQLRETELHVCRQHVKTMSE